MGTNSIQGTVTPASSLSGSSSTPVSLDGQMSSAAEPYPVPGPQGPQGPQGEPGKDALHGYPIVEATESYQELQPNTYYRWGVMESLEVTFVDGDPARTNEYMFEFTCGEQPTELIVPESVRWTTDPEIVKGLTYQVSILNNIGVIVGA